ncbi:MAG: GyrI-like domain-containing protein [Gemmatimonadota bacterium]
MTTPALEPEAVHVLPILCARCEVRSGSDEISSTMVEAMGKLAGYIQEHELEHAGPPRTVYTSYGAEGVRMTVGFPIVEPDVEPPTSEDVSIGELAHGPALRFSHVGPYEKLPETYQAITAWMIEHGLMESEADWSRFSPMWEEYVSDPVNTPPDELLTYIYLPAPDRDEED